MHEMSQKERNQGDRAPALAFYLWVLSLSVGLAIGASIGAAIGRVGIGISVGAVAGVSAGLFFARRVRSNSKCT